jgi:hypothetical protein
MLVYKDRAQASACSRSSHPVTFGDTQRYAKRDPPIPHPPQCGRSLRDRTR